MNVKINKAFNDNDLEYIEYHINKHGTARVSLTIVCMTYMDLSNEMINLLVKYNDIKKPLISYLIHYALSDKLKYISTVTTFDNATDDLRSCISIYCSGNMNYKNTLMTLIDIYKNTISISDLHQIYTNITIDPYLSDDVKYGTYDCITYILHLMVTNNTIIDYNNHTNISDLIKCVLKCNGPLLLINTLLCHIPEDDELLI